MSVSRKQIKAACREGQDEELDRLIADVRAFHDQEETVMIAIRPDRLALVEYTDSRNEARRLMDRLRK